MASKIIKLLFLTTLMACDGTLSISGGPTSKVSIENPDQLTAHPGESVVFGGKNLSESIEVFINGRSAPFRLIDSNSAAVEIPEDVESGILKFTFSVNSKIVGRVSLMNGYSVNSMTPVLIQLESVCESYIVMSENGELVRGLADCSMYEAACSDEGQSDCRATPDYPAVKKSELASKIVEGQTLAGVRGEADTSCEK